MTAVQTPPHLFPFDNSYARLPERFYARLPPATPPSPRLLKLNHGLAGELGLDPEALAGPAGLAALSGTQPPEGAEPLAAAYAGHQFGGWSPQLGDGRALLLGEIIDRQGRRRDIQLKGSGRTPFSRGGDGLAPLGPVLREYIISEAMAALGVPTTRSLAAVATGGRVYRETALPGAVLTRVAASHIRVGTFQYFYARGDIEALRLLADHAIARHDPEAAAAGNPYLAFLDGVIERQVRLIARWMSLGFIHGVMNTDNMTISGETIDYGPCAFMDAYHPMQVYSSIDHYGRYAYGAQPQIGQWNLAQLAQSLLPLIDGNEDAALPAAQELINSYPDRYRDAFTQIMREKLGLTEQRPEDLTLIEDLLGRMAQGAADFTLTFRRLGDEFDPAGEADSESARMLFSEPALFDEWAEAWRRRLAQETVDPARRRASMQSVNPQFIPRNHRVEAAIVAALEDDFGPFETLLTVLARPYAAQPEHAAHAIPPAPDQEVRATFCGT